MPIEKQRWRIEGRVRGETILNLKDVQPVPGIPIGHSQALDAIEAAVVLGQAASIFMDADKNAPYWSCTVIVELEPLAAARYEYKARTE